MRPAEGPWAGLGDQVLLEQDPPALRMGSLVGKEHWGEEDRGTSLLTRLSTLGRDP